MDESNLGVVINELDAKLGQAACFYELNAIAYASPPGPATFVGAE